VAVVVVVCKHFPQQVGVEVLVVIAVLLLEKILVVEHQQKNL
jgi:hypothetical protein